jgi:hypothetical protein
LFEEVYNANMPIILFLKDIKLFAMQTKIELVLAAVNVVMIFDLQNALNLFERIIVYSCRTFKKSLHQNLTFMNTEIFQHIHWLAVLAGALGYFVLGAIWYTVLFGKQWRSYNASLMNTPDAKKGAGAIMFLSFIMMFVTAIGLSIIAERFGVFGWQGGLKLGLLTGICFAAMAIHISYIYEKRPIGLHLINGLYNVAGNIIAAIIICMWR